ncbi:hypothetical protein NPIL_53181, partial [Nephila pilipes]
GDQALCDEFIKCYDGLPKRFGDIAKKCMDKIPDGKRCSKDKELFNSAKDRMQFMVCQRDQLPKEFTAEEWTTLKNAQGCFKAVADKCIKMKGSKP